MAKRLRRTDDKGKSPVEKIKPPTKPECPIHHVNLSYTPDRGWWECPRIGCSQKAMPAHEFEKGQPIIGKGRVEVLLTDDPGGSRDGRVYLRAVDNNVMMDVTQLLNDIEGVHLNVDTEAPSVTVSLEVVDRIDARTRR